MDIQKSDFANIENLSTLWKSTPGAELEALITDMDLIGWQDIIQYLRHLGMHEVIQPPKLNIIVDTVRFTLESIHTIKSYCRDNMISNKPYTAMTKELIDGANPVNLPEYNSRINLKREVTLERGDARLTALFPSWKNTNKLFRSIQRFEFIAPYSIPIRFDISVVKQSSGKSFQASRVTSQSPRYEIEVELTAPRNQIDAHRATKYIIQGLTWLLQGRQRSFILIRNTTANLVKQSIATLFGLSSFQFPGLQPVTLEIKNFITSGKGINLRTHAGGYNVTEKADGLRTLLFVDDKGVIFLIDGGGRVYATGKFVDKKYARTLLDGEWIRKDRVDARVCKYYAFDILSTPNGNLDILTKPFMGTTIVQTGVYRHTTLLHVVTDLSSATQHFKNVPTSDNLQISIKTFRAAQPGNDIFQLAGEILDAGKTAPYNTDGLIFTPNITPMPMFAGGRVGGTWPAQFKWKPSRDNTIDFLIIVDKERGPDGALTNADSVNVKYIGGKTIQYKTLRLFVGSNKRLADDPRSAILSSSQKQTSKDTGDTWHAAEFQPIEPSDQMASVCYVQIDSFSNDILSTAGEVLQSEMITEMSYHSEREPGWRWEPMRVRHDKTERWAKQKKNTGSKKSGGSTMNADWVANSIWNSIHNPITEFMIRTGQTLQQDESVRRDLTIPTHGRDMVAVQKMVNFHNAIKQLLLSPQILPNNSTLCDLGMGSGSDISIWSNTGVNFVFGCDAVADNINAPNFGAYSRLVGLSDSQQQNPTMVFAQADMARRLMTGDAAFTSNDREILDSVFSTTGAVVPKGGFDVVSCMFSLHYMWRDESTRLGFLQNVADCVRLNGYFVGCEMDADRIQLLFNGSTYVDLNNVLLMTNLTHTTVDVDLLIAGESHREYLVKWSQIESSLKECGLELLTRDELKTIGLPASTQLFGDTLSLFAENNQVYAMLDSLKKYSSLHRWFVFKRRSEIRPIPPTSIPNPPKPDELTQRRTNLTVPAILQTIPAIPQTVPAIPQMGPAIPQTVPAIPQMGPATTQTIPAILQMGPAILQTVPATLQTGPAILQTIPATPVSAPPQTIPAILQTGPATPVSATAPFIVNPNTRIPDSRLGPDLTDWPRYMSFTTQIEMTDMAESNIKYPNIEAAIASAMYQYATNKPELGPQLFGVQGSIHQKFVKERDKMTSERIPASEDSEVSSIRVAAGAKKRTSLHAVWDQVAWDNARDRVYQTYLAQRYDTDSRFHKMIDAINLQGGRILFANGEEPTYLGVGIKKIDGTITGGDNAVGEWMMSLGK